MEAAEEEKILRAGQIAGTALQEGSKKIKVGSTHLEVVEHVELVIKKMGGKLAFPVGINVGALAAHRAPAPDDPTVFHEHDVVKLDLGVHIDGFIADNALTVDLSKQHASLVNASRDALNAAIKKVKIGVEVREIGAVVQETITKAGFSPIRNLSGHLIEPYIVHAGITIPNYDNGDRTTLEDDMLIAIEPFAADGEGVIIEGKGGGIYRVSANRPVRQPHVRAVLVFLQKEFKTLPFSRRAVQLPLRDNAFMILEKEGILYHYPELVERSKGLVSQAEHTILVKDKPIVTTRVLEEMKEA